MHFLFIVAALSTWAVLKLPCSPALNGFEYEEMHRPRHEKI